MLTQCRSLFFNQKRNHLYWHDTHPFRFLLVQPPSAPFLSTFDAFFAVHGLVGQETEYTHTHTSTHTYVHNLHACMVSVYSTLNIKRLLTVSMGTLPFPSARIVCWFCSVLYCTVLYYIHSCNDSCVCRFVCIFSVHDIARTHCCCMAWLGIASHGAWIQFKNWYQHFTSFKRNYLSLIPLVRANTHYK